MELSERVFRCLAALVGTLWRELLRYSFVDFDALAYVAQEEKAFLEAISLAQNVVDSLVIIQECLCGPAGDVAVDSTDQNPLGLLRSCHCWYTSQSVSQSFGSRC